VLGVRLSWLGKRDLFRGPMGPVFRRLGGLPVDRGAPQNQVRQAIDWFADTPRLLLAIAPSGTRSRVAHWKSGFYHIARGANVPVLCTFLDYGRKVAGVGPAILPTGDVRADMDRIRAFYEGIVGRYPSLATPVRLREEEA
jgi:1-acyl-sn-glycerol-3-phosphate acyltransferase